MQKQLFSTINYPKGVTSVAFGVTNKEAAAQYLLGQTATAFAQLGQCKEKMALTKKLPMRLHSKQLKCSFTFEQMLQDDFGNVTAYYTFKTANDEGNGIHEIESICENGTTE